MERLEVYKYMKAYCAHAGSSFMIAIHVRSGPRWLVTSRVRARHNDAISRSAGVTCDVVVNKQRGA